MKSGYERTWELVRPRLKNCDLKEAAARPGFFEYQNGCIRALFLGQDYEITSQDVLCTSDDAAHPVEKSLLAYYITSSGCGEPENTYLSASQIKRYLDFEPIAFLQGCLIRRILSSMAEAEQRKMD